MEKHDARRLGWQGALLSPDKGRFRLVVTFLVLGFILGALIGLSKGQGVGGVVLEAITGALIAGAVTLATSTGSKRSRDQGRDNN